jgi:hypothetical protein
LGKVEEIDQLGDLVVHGKIILKKDLTEIGCDGLDWILPTLEMVQWWSLVSMVMKLRVS